MHGTFLNFVIHYSSELSFVGGIIAHKIHTIIKWRVSLSPSMKYGDFYDRSITASCEQQTKPPFEGRQE